MGMTNMLTQTIHLDRQPGGIQPELHLKEGTSSTELTFLVLTEGTMTDYKSRDCYIRGVRPDGHELFLRAFSGAYDNRVQVHFYRASVTEMAKVAGRYTCTLTLVDTNVHPTRATYMNYNFQTVLPFTVIVHPKARRDEDA